MDAKVPDLAKLVNMALPDLDPAGTAVDWNFAGAQTAADEGSFDATLVSDDFPYAGLNYSTKLESAQLSGPWSATSTAVDVTHHDPPQPTTVPTVETAA